MPWRTGFRILQEINQGGIVKRDKIETKEDESMPLIRQLGNLNRSILEEEFGKIQTDEIIVTGERLEHIKERHPEDFYLFKEYCADIVKNPDYVIKDVKHEGTVFMVKKLPDINLNVIVRIALSTDRKGLKNSVMTFYRIRERNLNKLKDKNVLLYKRE